MTKYLVSLVLVLALMQATLQLVHVSLAELGVVPHFDGYISGSANVYSDEGWEVGQAPQPIFGLSDIRVLVVGLDHSGSYAEVEVNSLNLYGVVVYDRHYWVHVTDLHIWNDGDWRPLETEVLRNLNLPAASPWK